jgi:7-carboxy-7-deazaguanine synthase
MGIRYSEIFYSFQGEAELAGVPAIWLRFFGCNLNCNGFGQKDPTDPATYVLPYKTYDLTNITKVEQLPVWSTGCDSSYSWSEKYKHLVHDATVQEIVDRLIEKNTSEYNPRGLFQHPVTHQDIMLCFTGGEPMLNQAAMIEILQELYKRGNVPRIVTVETNATKKISMTLDNFLRWEAASLGIRRWHWAMSPKLFTVSGEKDRVNSDVISSYANMQYLGGKLEVTSVLKFVCNGTEKNWEELEAAVAHLRKSSCLSPVWVMPVGARQEEQTSTFLGPLCIEAMRRGYNIATRNQVAVFGNIIGS